MVNNVTKVTSATVEYICNQRGWTWWVAMGDVIVECLRCCDYGKLRKLRSRMTPDLTFGSNQNKWHPFSWSEIRALYCSRKKYARVWQSHKRAPKVPVVDLDEAQRVWGTRRKLRGIYLLKVLKWDQNWSKCSFVPRACASCFFRMIGTCAFCKQTGSIWLLHPVVAGWKSSSVFFVIDVMSELPLFFYRALHNRCPFWASSKPILWRRFDRIAAKTFRSSVNQNSKYYVL